MNIFYNKLKLLERKLIEDRSKLCKQWFIKNAYYNIYINSIHGWFYIVLNKSSHVRSLVWDFRKNISLIYICIWVSTMFMWLKHHEQTMRFMNLRDLNLHACTNYHIPHRHNKTLQLYMYALTFVNFGGEAPF